MIIAAVPVQLRAAISRVGGAADRVDGVENYSGEQRNFRVFIFEIGFFRANRGDDTDGMDTRKSVRQVATVATVAAGAVSRTR